MRGRVDSKLLDLETSPRLPRAVPEGLRLGAPPARTSLAAAGSGLTSTGRMTCSASAPPRILPDLGPCPFVPPPPLRRTGFGGRTGLVSIPRAKPRGIGTEGSKRGTTSTYGGLSVASFWAGGPEGRVLGGGRSLPLGGPAGPPSAAEVIFAAAGARRRARHRPAGTNGGPWRPQF